MSARPWRGGRLTAESCFAARPLRRWRRWPELSRTLAVWRDRFRTAWPSLVPMGFDERFRRLWEYYLAYCEAGFLSGNIDVRQVVFAKSG